MGDTDALSRLSHRCRILDSSQWVSRPEQCKVDQPGSDRSRSPVCLCFMSQLPSFEATQQQYRIPCHWRDSVPICTARGDKFVKHHRADRRDARMVQGVAESRYGAVPVVSVSSCVHILIPLLHINIHRAHETTDNTSSQCSAIWKVLGLHKQKILVRFFVGEMLHSIQVLYPRLSMFVDMFSCAYTW